MSTSPSLLDEAATADALVAEMAAAEEERKKNYTDGRYEMTNAEFRKGMQLKYHHQAMVDAMVANPYIQVNELAKIFGRTPSWISIVKNSDAFQALLAKRTEELTDPLIREEIDARFKTITQVSLQRLQEKLEKPASALEDAFVLKAVELGMKSQGIGLPKTEVTVQQGGGDRLDRLADRLVGLLGPRQAPRPLPDVVEVQSRPT